MRTDEQVARAAENTARITLELVTAKRTLADRGQVVNDISAMIDGTYAADLSPETHMWRRCTKVCEESGEVIEALLGVSGENPRKGVTHTRDDLRRELLDVALAALGAVAFLDGNEADPAAALDEHARFVRGRLAVAIGGAK